MPKIETPMIALKEYLPEGSFDYVIPYLNDHKVHLTITRERSTILGNYKKYPNKNHIITINGNLNRYSFLITLLHELAHLLAFENYGTKIVAHGTEWKYEFGKILSIFISKKIFPTDIEKELISTLHNPAATSCAETSLLRVLRKYDPHKPGVCFLEELPESAIFRIKNGRVFKKGKQMRKRFLCKEIDSQKSYLFSPVAEVYSVN